MPSGGIDPDSNVRIVGTGQSGSVLDSLDAP